MSGHTADAQEEALAERDTVATALAERGISHIARVHHDKDLGWITQVWVNLQDSPAALNCILACGLIGFDLRVTHGGAGSLEAAVVGEQKCLCGALLPPGQMPMAVSSPTSVGPEAIAANTCPVCRPVAHETGDLSLAAGISQAIRAGLAAERARPPVRRGAA